MSEFNCPKCGAEVDEAHDEFCSVARCACCDQQALQCETASNDWRCTRPWAGSWPGDLECLEFGFFQEDGSPDLNTLQVMTHWDARQQRRVLND